MTQGKYKTMLEIRQIVHRLRTGHSNRRIQREIGVDRSIVQKIRELSAVYQWLDPSLPMPRDEEIVGLLKSPSSIHKQHLLDPHKEDLERWTKEGVSAVVIHRILVEKCPCNPQMIRRYLRRYFPKQIEPVMVRSTEPGRDLEIDFGYLGQFLHSDGSKKKAWVFSFRLRHSRRVYREVVMDQKADTFLLAHIHAFEWLGGVPKNIILDNCKAAIIQCSVDNDHVRRSYQELAEHYGFIISPCLPRTPEHKGGVEGDIKYVKGNFLPYFRTTHSNSLPTIQDVIESLGKWGREVDDTHVVHGVGRSPLEIFESEEKKALRALPESRWELTDWSQCMVRKDWRIMYDCAYYAVPYRLIGEIVQVCATAHTIRIFHNHQEVAYHTRAKTKWEYKRKAEYAPPLHEQVLSCSREGLLSLAEKVGLHTSQAVQEILSHPTVDKLKPARRLLNLANTYSEQRLEKACERAILYKTVSYNSVKSILINDLEAQSDCSEKKIIPISSFRFARDLSVYKSRETFEEKLERLHPVSKHGNAMLGVFQSILADQMIDEAYDKDK